MEFLRKTATCVLTTSIYIYLKKNYKRNQSGEKSTNIKIARVQHIRKTDTFRLVQAVKKYLKGKVFPLQARCDPEGA